MKIMEESDTVRKYRVLDRYGKTITVDGVSAWKSKLQALNILDEYLKEQKELLKDGN